MAMVLLAPGVLPGQLTTGTLEGILRAMNGHPLAGVAIIISGGTGLRAVIHSNANGEFAMTVPYGRYRLSGEHQDGSASSGTTVVVAPLQTTRFDLVVDASGALRAARPPARTPGIRTDATSGGVYPEAFSLQGVLLSREAASVTEPLDFSGLSDNRLPVVSQRGFSWTHSQYKLQGMDATDSWQPGLPAVLYDVQSLDTVVVRSAFAQAASWSNGTEVEAFVAQPGASHSRAGFWHGALSTAHTGSALSSNNLPAPANRGLVQQADQFRQLTRDGLELGGPLTRRADFYVSARGQWALQAEPLARPGTDQGSRLLLGNARGRVRVSARDRLDAVYSGSRIDLSDGGVPAGLEAWTATA
jgi:hypothetical protein